MATITTPPPLIVILGPTASGKTSVSIELAKQVNGEILCADSRTVYKYMNIGTAKPTLKEQQGIPHHLLDIIEPSQKYSTAQFQADANEAISDIRSRGRMPIMVGGTGLYIDSVLFNYTFSGKAAKRNPLNERHLMNANQSDRTKPLRTNTLVIGIMVDRETLKSRIADRVEQMFKDGFLNEVAYLAKKYGWENESMSGIGYRLAREHLEGDASIEDVKDAFVRRDLSLAKRQMTWFKRNKEIQWFEYTDTDKIIQAGCDFVKQFRL